MELGPPGGRAREAKVAQTLPGRGGRSKLPTAVSSRPQGGRKNQKITDFVAAMNATPGKSGKRQMSSPDSEEERERRSARRELLEKETEWMNEREKRLWQFIEKKMMRLRKEMSDEYMDTWLWEEKEWERKLEERNKRIEELEKKVEELEKLKGHGMEEELDKEIGKEAAEEIENSQWSQVLKKKRKNKLRDEVVEVLDDRNVQKKLVKLSVEANDKKQREKNVVVKGWSEVKGKYLDENDIKDSRKVANVIVQNYLEAKVEIEEVEWSGTEEKKVLVLKLKSKEEKSELLEKRTELKGTKIYLDDDLTKEERKIQGELLNMRKELKKKDESKKIWVRYRKLCVDGNWLSWEELKENKSEVVEIEGENIPEGQLSESQKIQEEQRKVETTPERRFTF